MKELFKFIAGFLAQMFKAKPQATKKPEVKEDPFAIIDYINVLP